MKMPSAPITSVKYLHNVLEHIQSLCVKATEEGNPDKHQRIRVKHWVRKLRSQPTSNPTWLKSVLEYANVLLQMVLEGVIEEPFTKMPPQGPLAALPRHQVTRLRAKEPRQVVITQSVRPSSLKTHPNSTQQLLCNNSKGNVRAIAAADKQIQTQEQDDQWEWQRVWKGAFDKMHHQLQLKMETVEALATETKELRALVAGYEKALEEAERNQRDIEAKHLAEIENLRAVHSLELSDLQARHRQKLEEVALQNDEKLFSRRRESNCIRSALSCSTTPRDDHADANADFLQYIDSFYLDTRNLAARNKK